MKKFFIILTCLLSVACVQVSDVEKDSEQSETKDVPESRTAATDSRVTIVPLPEAHRYEVRIPSFSKTNHLVRMLKDQPQSKLVMPLESVNGAFVDKNVQAGSTYIYSLYQVISGESQEVDQFEVRIPQDLLIQQNQTLTSDTEWNIDGRVFITDTGSITTNGFKFTLRAKSLFTDRGLIQTFPEGAKAGLNQPGRNGNVISLYLEFAEGDLRLAARGEHGGDGSPGGPFNGQPSNCNRDNRPVGKQGNPGLTGKNGGQSGTFQVNLKSSSEFKIQFSSSAGAAGNGGIGGLGEQGMCLSSHGPKGPDGAAGLPGQVERSHLFDQRGMHVL